MSESRFDRSLLPPALDFYRGELGEVNRPDRRGWAMVVGGCPFHPSKSRKSFFVHIDGGFYCSAPIVAPGAEMFSTSCANATTWISRLQRAGSAPGSTPPR